jgi:poly(beta-D-mannuronate) lyase
MGHRHRPLVTCFTLVLCSFVDARGVRAEAHRVSSESAFNSAATRLAPGDEIVITDGVYADWDLRVPASGRPDAPLTVRPESVNGVVLGGVSRIVVTGAHVRVSGLRVEHVSVAPIIALRGGNGRVTDCHFVSSGAAENHSRHLVRAESNDNRVDHNEFTDCLSKCGGIWGAPRRNRFDHNVFRDLRRFGQEEVEALQIGQTNPEVVTHTVVEHNLFDRASGTAEIVGASGFSVGQTVSGRAG